MVEFLHEVFEGPSVFEIDITGMQRILVTENDRLGSDGESGRTASALPYEIRAIGIGEEFDGWRERPGLGDAS